MNQQRPPEPRTSITSPMQLPGAVLQNRTRPGSAEQPTLWAAHDRRNPLPSYVAISSKALAAPGGGGTLLWSASTDRPELAL
jgi:hypothetical protein